MIHIRTVKEFCSDYTEIEGYEKAVNDTTQTYICHHIQGEYKTREELIELGCYYNVPPYLLRFVTKEEHNRLHKPHLGKKLSKEQKRKCTPKTKVQYWLGKDRGEEFSKKMSEVQKGKKLTDKTKKHISNKLKDKPHSEFGKMFFEKYGYIDSNSKD